jgi:hypothetical protein
MLGLLISAAFLWVAIILVAKDHNVDWWEQIKWMVLAIIAAWGVELLLEYLLKVEFIVSFVIALFVFSGVVFYKLWINYGGIGLPKIIKIFSLYLVLQILWYAFWF